MSTVAVPTTPLGNLIRIGRLDRGWSQTSLGDQVGVAQSIISAWENGKAIPSAPLLLQLAEVLHGDRSAFFDAVEVARRATRP